MPVGALQALGVVHLIGQGFEGGFIILGQNFGNGSAAVPGDGGSFTASAAA